MNASSIFKTVFPMLRIVAVLSSSLPAIIASMLPIFLYYSFSPAELTVVIVLLLTGVVLVQGILTHVLNDYTDYMSGTDAESPAILSGGSRIVQNNLVTIRTLRTIGLLAIATVVTLIVIFFLTDYIKIASLLLIGFWSSASYSLPPVRSSYYPWAGEWVSMFPAFFFIGFAGPWLVMESLPLWAYQNALLVALFSLIWNMVHHIPDRFADENAAPAKITTVVWMKNKFGDKYSSLPALLYSILCSICAFWVFLERPIAGAGAAILSFTAIFIVLRMDVEDNEDVSREQKKLFLLTAIVGLWSGLFI
ncbi:MULTISPECIES: prenyltransferase [Salimicrobium]|uniref:1,4-dihydroxy-2-naphthoate prenyltransferase n=1 Tax=Salimicrobium humidisoli TaxID=2029857 RepID=A0ABX4HSK2_9BACI|nr:MULTISPECIES: prenyltransferase [Salimicrobium]PBB05680.1 1,4-dihydroxy-2-naphthoate prenyltransferase [Salimicrobium humidisoli]